VIVEALSGVYGAAATWRRRWYAANPSRTRHLARPVISVGNLRVGGTGKTPVVACIAQLLLEHGERPAILSRGYAREKSSAQVTVVSDGTRVLADLAHAGDEPLLLARSLPGVPVLVCADRYAAGLHAESRLGATVHLLDDGFQHVRLARDIDLLLVDEHDLDDRVLPAGRLREPLSNGSAADAVIVPAGNADSMRTVGERLGIAETFSASRTLGTPVMLRASDPQLSLSTPVLAVAAIARPERFFEDVRRAGFPVAGTLAFRDHHPFTVSDVERMAAAAGAAGAGAIVTTEKDQMRLEPLDLPGIAVAALPLHTRIEPADAFAAWMMTRLAGVRAGNSRPSR
jgi:tetraacyldisaccharide 4'-kinase